MWISLTLILLLATKRVLADYALEKTELKKNIHLMSAAISIYLLISTHLK